MLLAWAKRAHHARVRVHDVHRPLKLVAMERRGVLVDRDWAEAQTTTVESRLKELEETIERDHRGINVRSNKQLSEYLFDDGKETLNDQTDGDCNGRGGTG